MSPGKTLPQILSRRKGRGPKVRPAAARTACGTGPYAKAAERPDLPEKTLQGSLGRPARVGRLAFASLPPLQELLRRRPGCRRKDNVLLERQGNLLLERSDRARRPCEAVLAAGFMSALFGGSVPLGPN